jgi:hypothetical protein
MKTVIIALPVDDDADIYEIGEVIDRAADEWDNRGRADGDDDAAQCCVFEDANALAEDLGLVPDETRIV